MNIHLLTHFREYKRPSNTGTVVVDALGGSNSNRVLWERVHPDKSILKLIERKKAVLIYKHTNDSELFEERRIEDLSEFEDFILLDGTWQEAGKMYNKSPYLQDLPVYSLPGNYRSKYNIRRNQKTGGLCTAECVIEILKIKGESGKADLLDKAFRDFLKRMITRVVVLPSKSSD